MDYCVLLIIVQYVAIFENSDWLICNFHQCLSNLVWYAVYPASFISNCDTLAWSSGNFAVSSWSVLLKIAFYLCHARRI